MKQRVAIARTLFHDPEILILDEPTSGLDVISAKHIIEMIKSEKEKGKIIILSTHIMQEVELLAENLAIVNKGKVIYDNTFQEFKNSNASISLTQGFINTIENSNH